MEQKRIIGIDLLRILSMYMIMTLHTMSNGGGLLYHSIGSAHTQIIMFMTFLNNVAVDLFALISGYVGLSSHHRTSRIVELWLQVVFYSWLILIAFCVFKPSLVSRSQFIASLFPTFSMQYWYFNSYLLVFVFMPLLNLGIDKLSHNQFKYLCILLFVLSSILGSTIFHDKIFNLNNGFSGMWLIIMYLYGAYIRKHGFLFRQLSIRKYLLMYLLISIIGVIVCNLTVLHYHNYSNAYVLYNYWNIWFAYNTPFAVLGSIFVFLAFLKINIHNQNIRYFIIKLGSLSFGTYLLQTNYIVYAWFRGHYGNYYNHNIIIMILLILLTAFIWYLIGTIVDLLRNYLFVKFALPDRVTKLLNLCFHWIK